MNEIIQYTILGIILLGCVVWLFLRWRRRSRTETGPCAGCSLAETCKKKAIIKKNEDE